MKTWVGTPEAMQVAIGGAKVVDLRTEMAVDASDVDRWVGIEPPPVGAHVFTIRSPIEASGFPEWRHYVAGYAPECDLVAVRVADEERQKARMA